MGTTKGAVVVRSGCCCGTLLLQSSPTICRSFSSPGVDCCCCLARIFVAGCARCSLLPPSSAPSSPHHAPPLPLLLRPTPCRRPRREEALRHLRPVVLPVPVRVALQQRVQVVVVVGVQRGLCGVALRRRRRASGVDDLMTPLGGIVKITQPRRRLVAKAGAGGARAGGRRTDAEVGAVAAVEFRGRVAAVRLLRRKAAREIDIGP